MLSTGNKFTEVFLDKSPNTLVIGSNGAGKSTILDALCFGLFGKPFRNINKPQLINSINQRDMLVEIEFDIGRKSYLVRRGVKPGVFEIFVDGTQLHQQANLRDQQEHLERYILQLNYKSFTQIVILGSASFTPFMQLKTKDRREVIEDLLDIQIFSSMNNILKSRFSELKTEYTENRYALDLNKEKATIQNDYLKTLKRDNQSRIEEYNIKISNLESQIAELKNSASSYENEIDLLNDKLALEDSVNSQVAKLEELQKKLETTKKKVEKEIDFYSSNDSCPTCKQEIDDEFKETVVCEKHKKVDDIDKALPKLKEDYQKVSDKISEFMEVHKELSEKNKELATIQNDIIAQQKIILSIEEEKSNLAEKSDAESDAKEKLLSLKKEHDLLKERRAELLEQKEVFEIASTMLKDSGIKTKIIKQYVPIINKLVNKYLSAMDFFVNFELDENFNEKIKSRYRDEFSYDNFSEGEKMRIDLSLLFTWRAIAKLKNSVNTNLLILDEVFDSSLDGNGTEEFLKIIETLGSDSNIFVISHKGDVLQDKFRSIVRFEKKNNFSVIAKG
jgi:DNA repair exonuclease SbcCD ATPase subunit